jgi:phosphohistidine phosphatase
LRRVSSVHVWLLRHGDAVPHGAVPDFQRALTEKGVTQARAAGAAIAALGLHFDAVYSSPKVRARDTARMACEAAGATMEVTPVDAIAGGFDRSDLRDLLAGHRDGERVLLVGHEPDLSQLVHDLSGGRVDFKKGGLAGLRVERGSGELLALLRPAELSHIARSPG